MSSAGRTKSTDSFHPEAQDAAIFKNAKGTWDFSQVPFLFSDLLTDMLKCAFLQAGYLRL